MTKWLIFRPCARCVSLIISQIFIFIITLQIVESSQIEIFKKPNFEDLGFESGGVRDTCYSPDSIKDIWKQSIRTDSCIIIYADGWCKGFNSKIFPPGVTNLTKLEWEANRSRPDFRSFDSYKICNEEEMKTGGHINVDFYKRYSSDNFPPSSSHAKLGTIRNLKTCKNLPSSVPATDISIDNHFHPIRVYSQRDCTGHSKVVPGGHNWFSFYGEYFCIDSCGPHFVSSISPYQPTPPPTIPQVQLSYQTFMFLSTAQDVEVLEDYMVDVQMAPETTFTNGETFEVTREYSASGMAGMVDEFLEITTPAVLSKMRNDGVETDFQVDWANEVDNEAEIPFFTEASMSKLESGLRDAFSLSANHPLTNRKLMEMSREFPVSEEIQVPACTELMVAPQITKVNLPIEYKVYLKIQGKRGTHFLTSKQIRDHLNLELRYVRDWDSNTIMAVASGVMMAQYGLSSHLEVVGEKDIGGCETGETFSIGDIFGICCVVVVGGGVLIGFCWCTWRYFLGRQTTPNAPMNVFFSRNRNTESGTADSQAEQEGALAPNSNNVLRSLLTPSPPHTKKGATSKQQQNNYQDPPPPAYDSINT